MSIFRSFWRVVAGESEPETVSVRPAFAPAQRATVQALDIPANDPILAYFQTAPGAVDMATLQLDSPGVRALRQAGVRVSVPLVSHGELVGLLNLGQRLSEQEYSTDDRRLLDNLATQAAPALRVAQLAQQQQVEARERERLEQELRVASLIQQTLLPKEPPRFPGWEVAAYYQPARAVGGDFYDYIYFPDGRLGLVQGDVTDKGVPAALVMATTRSIVRQAAQALESPGKVLQRSNDLLCQDIPPKMFVTCLYALLDPESGVMTYANAGHNLPYRRNRDGVDELRATGMPLGLMQDMAYEEREVQLAPGESVLFYSDGLIEAHGPRRDMFGFPRLKSLMSGHPGGAALMEFLLGQLRDFTGPEWEQEDDVTLVTLERALTPGALPVHAAQETGASARSEGWRTLAEFSVPSQAGNDRLAMEQAAEALKDLGLPLERLENLKTAVAEATENAIEYGNKYQADLPVEIRVEASEKALRVTITDHGGGPPIHRPDTPDLEAKLSGRQGPRGWGLFLIEKMVDKMQLFSDGKSHTVELVMNLEGGGHG